MTISQTLLPEFDNEMASTRKLLSAVPEGRWDYKPHEKSMSLAQLAGHIATLPSYATTIASTDELSMSPGEYKPFLPTSRKELIDRFEEEIQKARTAIESTKDEDWMRTWTFKFGGQTVFSLPKIACYRTMAMNHLIHHRGQLGVYLRLNNVEFPGMYGPSADEMKFWTQAQTA